VKLVGFVDESGRPVYCCRFTVVCLWCIVEEGTSYYSVGRQIASNIAKLSRLTKARELKYSYLKKRKMEQKALEEISKFFNISHVSEHILSRVESIETRVKFCKKLLSNVLSQAPKVDRAVIIFDESPVPINVLRKRLIAIIRGHGVHEVEIKAKSSIKVKGLQLVDIVAGYIRERGKLL